LKNLPLDFKAQTGRLPLQPITPKTRNERVLFDYSYLKKRDQLGNLYMLLFINAFTKFIWGIVSRHMKAENCADFIKNTFRYGQFELWQCDNGKHLKNKKVKKEITDLGERLITIAPYHPQANSQIERPNGTIKRLMRLEKEGNPQLTWQEALDNALNKYNGRKHSTIKMAPRLAEWLEPENTYRLTGYHNKFEAEFSELPMEERQQKVDECCASRIAKAAEQMVKSWNKRHHPITFEEGEEVRVRISVWRLRPKGEKIWRYRARILTLVGTSYARLEWVLQGPEKDDVPGAREKKLWPLRNLAKYRGNLTSETFGPLFEERESNKARYVSNELLYHRDENLIFLREQSEIENSAETPENLEESIDISDQEEFAEGGEESDGDSSVYDTDQEQEDPEIFTTPDSIDLGIPISDSIDLGPTPDEPLPELPDTFWNASATLLPMEQPIGHIEEIILKRRSASAEFSQLSESPLESKRRRVSSRKWVESMM
jgi:hypothetical protein